MRKKEFFEVLGKLDDDIVKGAKLTMKRKVSWKVWVAMAACFTVMLFTVPSIFSNYSHQ